MKSIAAVFYGLALATSVWSQAASPAFEVASIKPSKAPAALADGRVPGQMIRDPGRVTLTYVSVQNLLAQAYRIKNFQISGPDWLDSERFDIVAKLPKDADEEQLPAMLQSLLRDRFRLAFHLESRTVTAYVLVTAKGGPKMSAVDDTTPSGVRTTAGPIRRHLSGKIGMMYLAGLLSNMLDRPVVDMTELSGRYDVDLDWSDTSETGSHATLQADDPPSIFTAIQEKLGLRLETRKTPVGIYAIDHVERVPTEN